MSILAYVGVPGSGKSYDAVENQILPMLRQGRRVVTNIPLKAERIRETIETGEIVELPLQRVLAEPDSIFEYATPGSVVVIDEAWKLLPTQKQDKIPAAYKTLLAEHRHMVDAARNSIVIVLVVQDLSMIGNFARGLIEQTYLHTKLSALGLDKAYRIDIYTGAVTGQRPPESKKVRSLNGFFREETYRLYDSHTMAQGAGEGAREKSGDSRAVLWKRPIFLVMPVMAIVLVVWGLPHLRGRFGGSQGGKGAPGTSVASPGAPAASRPVSGPPIAVNPTPRGEPQAWVFRGSMVFPEAPDKDVVFLSSGDASVTLPARRFCQLTLEGWWVCEYHGQTISSEISIRSHARASSGAPSAPQAPASQAGA